MDTATKQRLIGAAVLVALGAIFLPSLVMGPAPSSGVADVPMKIPDAPHGDMVTRDLPLVAPADSTPAGGAVGMTTATPGDNHLPTVDTAVANGAAVSAASDNAALPPGAAAGDYAVHFGSYATQKDADTLVAQLRAAHLPGYGEPTTLNGRNVWRVRIGPYTSRADAELAREQSTQLRSDVGARVVTLDAASDAQTPAPAVAAASPVPSPASVSQPAAKPQTPVVTTTALPPEPTPASAASTTPKPTPQPKPATPIAAASPAPAPTTPAPAKAAAAGVGFAVQLGAFSSADQANKLRDRARAAGISAYVERVQSDHGSLSRVRAGPVVDRAQADALKAQIKAKLGIDGMVRPQP